VAKEQYKKRSTQMRARENTGLVVLSAVCILTENLKIY